MNFLSQNWLWILIAAGALIFFMSRRGHRGHGGFGHGSFRHGDHGHGSDRDQRERGAQQWPEAAVDPVSGATVRTADALTSVHQGRVYYFASKESRDRFEASPGEFAARAAGGIVAGNAEPDRPRRRRRGC